MLFGILLAVSLISFGVFKWLQQSREKPLKSNQIYGVTIDDSWEEDISTKEVVKALKKLPVRPTVRIVMSRERSPKDYVTLFKRIAPVADVMAEPVDSYEMKAYPNVASYRKRFEQALKYLGPYTDIWEVGNEVNGTDWIKQKPKLIISKVEAAYDTVKAAGKKAAVTFYYENPDYDHDMIDWIDRHVPKKLKQGLDYSFISYYEDDNEGYQPNWKKVFQSFQKRFPTSKVGMGECGNTADSATQASKIAMMKHYYRQPIRTKRYVGGYFWWNWVQDCVSCDNNEIYAAFSDIWHKQAGR